MLSGSASKDVEVLSSSPLGSQPPTASNNLIRYSTVSKILKGYGYHHIRTRGSHHQWSTKDGVFGFATVPVHDHKVRGDVFRLILKSIQIVMQQELPAADDDDDNDDSSADIDISQASTNASVTDSETAVKKRRVPKITSPDSILATEELAEYNAMMARSEEDRLKQIHQTQSEMIKLEEELQSLITEASSYLSGSTVSGDQDFEKWKESMRIYKHRNKLLHKDDSDSDYEEDTSQNPDPKEILAQKLQEAISKVETYLAQKKIRVMANDEQSKGVMGSKVSVLDIEMYKVVLMELLTQSLPTGSASHLSALEKLFTALHHAKSRWWMGFEQNIVNGFYNDLMESVLEEISRCSTRILNSAGGDWAEDSGTTRQRGLCRLIIFLMRKVSLGKDENQRDRVALLAKIFRSQILSQVQTVHNLSSVLSSDLDILRRECDIGLYKQLLDDVKNVSSLLKSVKNTAVITNSDNEELLCDDASSELSKIVGFVRCGCGCPLVGGKCEIDEKENPDAAAKEAFEMFEKAREGYHKPQRVAHDLKDEIFIVDWILDFLNSTTKFVKDTAIMQLLFQALYFDSHELDKVVESVKKSRFEAVMTILIDALENATDVNFMRHSTPSEYYKPHYICFLSKTPSMQMYLDIYFCIMSLLWVDYQITNHLNSDFFSRILYRALGLTHCYLIACRESFYSVRKEKIDSSVVRTYMSDGLIKAHSAERFELKCRDGDCFDDGGASIYHQKRQEFLALFLVHVFFTPVMLQKSMLQSILQDSVKKELATKVQLSLDYLLKFILDEKRCTLEGLTWGQTLERIVAIICTEWQMFQLSSNRTINKSTKLTWKQKLASRALAKSFTQYRVHLMPALIFGGLTRYMIKLATEDHDLLQKIFEGNFSHPRDEAIRFEQVMEKQRQDFEISQDSCTNYCKLFGKAFSVALLRETNEMIIKDKREMLLILLLVKQKNIPETQYLVEAAEKEEKIKQFLNSKGAKLATSILIDTAKAFGRHMVSKLLQKKEDEKKYDVDENKDDDSLKDAALRDFLLGKMDNFKIQNIKVDLFEGSDIDLQKIITTSMDLLVFNAVREAMYEWKLLFRDESEKTRGRELLETFTNQIIGNCNLK